MADARYAFALPDGFGDLEAAPLLCAGLIGHRALRMTGDAERLGLYGFGASAHIVAQVARHQGRRVFAFVRAGDERRPRSRASWAPSGRATPWAPPPEELDAAIIFAPAGELVPAALRAVAPGGTVVCAGIHMSEIPAFPYEILWGERTLRSVANLTRADADGVPRARAARAGAHPRDDVRARRRRARAGRPARRPSGGRRRPRTLRAMHVELLYWDGCPSHPQALAELRARADRARARPRGDRRCARSPPSDAADAERFTGSPTIRIDGADVQETDEPTGLTCRVYHRRDGRVSPVPDPDDLRDALRAATEQEPA